MSKQKLLTGNEAIARGFWEAGGRVVSAYPGTPSTEVTENAAKYAELYAEWAPNEKVALEVAIGSSVAGARSLAAMKHVGLNVAADPLFTVAYTGVNGGLVVVVADDPGMHSSQNEQDSRHYAMAAKLPVLEPSDSTEARDYTKLALELSERFDTPVLLRTTTRVAHGQSLVELGERQEVALKDYEKDTKKYVMTPGGARPRHVIVEQHLRDLAAYAEESTLNREEIRGKKLGVVCAGAVYQYVREVLPEASIFKLGMTFPLPEKRLRAFASGVDELVVIEELDPIIENTLKAWGVACSGKDKFSLLGEIFPAHIAQAILGQKRDIPAETPDIPARPPVLCAGCPHRAVFHLLKKHKLTVTGDIGCYTLAAAPPLASIDTTVCMGASIGMAHGMEKARGAEFAKRTVAILGESTFMHSGITGLLNTVYNQSNTTTIILDNSITAMTGHQQNPASGLNAKLLPAPALDLVVLVEACGVECVSEVNPFDQAALEKALQKSLNHDGPAVIICKYPCVLLPQSQREAALCVAEERCIGCKICLSVGCPALGMAGKKARIDAEQCTGCGLCAGLCPKQAIGKGGAQA